MTTEHYDRTNKRQALLLACGPARLTRYALVCGYVQVAEPVADVEVKMWHEEPVYHVRAHDYRAHQRIMWESFASLGAARKCFAATKSALGGAA